MGCYVEHWIEEAHGWVPETYCDRARAATFQARAVMTADGAFPLAGRTLYYCSTNYEDVNCRICRHFVDYDAAHHLAFREMTRPVKVGDFINFLRVLTPEEHKRSLKGDGEDGFYPITAIVRDIHDRYLFAYCSSQSVFVKLLLADRRKSGDSEFGGRQQGEKDESRGWGARTYVPPEGWRSGLWHNYL